METSSTGPEKALPPLDFERMDRTAFRSFNSFEEADEHDRQFWRSRTPQERMQALEHIRKWAWGYDYEGASSRLQRVVGSAELRGS